MSGTINNPQLNNLLGLPMGLGPTPGAASLAANTAGIDPAALGQLYQAINRYTLQGTDPGISHSLLGGAASLYPDWSPMHQLANMQAQHTATSDAAAQQAAALAAAAPPQLSQEEQDRMQARTGNEGGR